MKHLLGELTSASFRLTRMANSPVSILPRRVACDDLRIETPSEPSPQDKSQPPMARSWRRSLIPIRFSRLIQMTGCVPSVRIDTSHGIKYNFYSLLSTFFSASRNSRFARFRLYAFFGVSTFGGFCGTGVRLAGFFTLSAELNFGR